MPMLTRFPETSILWVPAPAPVLIPVVPLIVVPVIVFVVAIVPNPLAIEPAAKAPTLVREELITPVPKVVELKTDVPLIWYAFPLETLIVPFAVIKPVPFNGDNTMFPVVFPPMVNVWFFVV